MNVNNKKKFDSEKLEPLSKRKISLRKEEKHKLNPFVLKAIKDVEENYTTKKKMIFSSNKEVHHQVVSSDGELIGVSAFLQKIEVDEKQFTKIYVNELKVMFNLSSSAIKVFAYIQSVLQPNEDKVAVLFDECMGYCFCSETSVLRGLDELTKKKIIARYATGSIYFINPLIFFNGNRITYIKQIIKKSKQEPVAVDLFDETKTTPLSKLP
jgi:hypothetical protein